MEIVHVYGHSCAGKQTLIKQLSDVANVRLRERFQIFGSTEKFWNRGEGARVFDPNTLWRPIEELETATFDHMLHKWQEVTQNFVLRLRQSRADCPQRVIVLWRTVEDLHRRNVERGWRVPTVEQLRDDLVQWLPRQVDQAAAAGMPVEYVDAADPLYKRIAGPPRS